MKNGVKRGSKIISSAVFVILMCLLVIILAYVLRVRYLSSHGRLGEIKINFYTILTQSMYPTIKAGDVIITYKTDNNEYNVGDVITFVSPSGNSGDLTITHRVSELYSLNGEYSYRTKGDNNSSADTAVVPAKNVLGRVIFRIPKAGYIQQFLVSKFGWIAMIVIPSLGIIIYDFLKIFKSISRKAGKKKLPEDPQVVEAKQKLEEVLSDEEIL